MRLQAALLLLAAVAAAGKDARPPACDCTAEACPLAVTVVAIPAVGHILPVLGDAAALLQRGHAVDFVTGETHVDYVQQWAKLMPSGDRLRVIGCESELRTSQDSLAQQWLPAAVWDTWLAVTDSWQALSAGLDSCALRSVNSSDVVVYDYLSTAGLHAAHAWNVPSVAVFGMADLDAAFIADSSPYQPSFLLGLPRNMSVLQHIASSAAHVAMRVMLRVAHVGVNRRRAALRLPPLPTPSHWLWRGKSQRAIVHSAPGLALPEAAPANVHFVGPTADALPRVALSDDLSLWLAEASDLPVVLLSLGSQAHPQGIALTPLLAEALEPLPLRLIWASRRDDAAPARMPAHWRRESWPPLATVLRHSAVKLFITHAGFNSVVESIGAGVPMAVLPLFGDQLGNAARAVDAGVALPLAHASLTVDAVRTTVLRLLREHEPFAARTEQLAAQLRAAGGAKSAVRLIEEHACLRSAHLHMADRTAQTYAAIAVAAAACAGLCALLRRCCRHRSCGGACSVMMQLVSLFVLLFAW